MSEHTLEAREHLAGCPEVLHPERGGRVEVFELTRPPRTDPAAGHVTAPAQPVEVIRCMQCGAARYTDIDRREEPRR